MAMAEMVQESFAEIPETAEKFIDFIVNDKFPYGGDSDSAVNKRRGDYFERVVRKFFELDSEYHYEFIRLWSWLDFAREVLKESSPDTGIDLVALDNFGSYHAIQCKFMTSGVLDQDSLQSFMALSSSPHATGGVVFDKKIVVTTANRLSVHLEKYIEGSEDYKLINRTRLFEQTDIDWSEFLVRGDEDSIRKKRRLEPRVHQREALEKIAEGFTEADRGKVIMACGTGKTLVGLRYLETLPVTRPVLVAMPSLGLIAQTIREYCQQSKDAGGIQPIAVCSQTMHRSRGDDESDTSLSEIAHPTTTDPERLCSIYGRVGEGKRVVIFSTYHSMEVISRAQLDYGLPSFSLIIADEAHRTAGVEKDIIAREGANFTLIHDAERIKGDKRLYMTATPRVFNARAKRRAEDSARIIYSMDDESKFGKVFYELNFGRAVSRGLLSDYLVLVTLVERQPDGEVVSFGAGADEKEFALEDIAKFHGIHKAIAKVDQVSSYLRRESPQVESQSDHIDSSPMRKVIIYTGKIAGSKKIAQHFNNFKPDNCSHMRTEIQHIDGTMNTLAREDKLSFLKRETDENHCNILTNAKCLTEGIDVPALDGICFFNKKKSIIDIVQAIGRVLRKSRGKRVGYIILPVCIDTDWLFSQGALDRAIRDESEFDKLWQTITALKDHDNRLVDEVDIAERVRVVNLSGEGSGEDKKRKRAAEVGERLQHISQEEIAKSVINAITEVSGHTAYWRHFGGEIKKKVDNIEKILANSIDTDSAKSEKFDELLASFRANIEMSIGKDLLISTVAQHIVTKPIFDALFTTSRFEANPTARALNGFAESFQEEVHPELREIKEIYRYLEKTIRTKDKAKREEIIEGLYNSFLQRAFPKVVEKHGIVYTPTECVNFMVRSADELLQKHLQGKRISDLGVKVLDPFSGMATFTAALLNYINEQGISKDDFRAKYEQDFWTSEITLLAYYIGLLRTENRFNEIYDDVAYIPFSHALYGDSFDIHDEKSKKQSKFDAMEEMGEKRKAHDQEKITMIITNPPYSVGQDDFMDDNANTSHEILENRIRETYLPESTSKGAKNSLFDSSIKALRLSTDRIENKGIISFITNGSFIDAISMSGVRACLAKEFSQIYIYNLKGNFRIGGKDKKKQGGNVFGQKTGVTVAIIFLIKDGTQDNENKNAEIYYAEIEDDLKTEAKLKSIADKKSIKGITTWQKITPNKHHSWINQETESYEKYIAMGSKDKKEQDHTHSLFNENYSIGFKTNRDTWITNYSPEKLETNMRLHIDTYNEDVEKRTANPDKNIDEIITKDKTKIKYSLALKNNLQKTKIAKFEEGILRNYMQYPFYKKYIYDNEMFIEATHKIKALFPDDNCDNTIIVTTGKNSSLGFNVFAMKNLLSKHIGDSGQCFGFYKYDKEGNKTEAITDWALQTFQEQYGNPMLKKEHIFHYIYGIFHHPEFKEKYANDLIKHFARVPLVKTAEDFQTIATIGKSLMEIHLNYETADPYKDIFIREIPPIKKDMLRDRLPDSELYKVGKTMNHPAIDRVKDKTKIKYNEFITLEKIPLRAYDYVVWGYSPMEWVMKRYVVDTDKDSGITQDPNDYAAAQGDPKYIVTLLRRAVTVSLKSVDLIAALPPLDIDENSPYYVGGDKCLPPPTPDSKGSLM